MDGSSRPRKRQRALPHQTKGLLMGTDGGVESRHSRWSYGEGERCSHAVFTCAQLADAQLTQTFARAGTGDALARAAHETRLLQ